MKTGKKKQTTKDELDKLLGRLSLDRHWELAGLMRFSQTLYKMSSERRQEVFDTLTKQNKIGQLEVAWLCGFFIGMLLEEDTKEVTL